MVKNLPVTAGDTGDSSSIPGSGRSPGGGNGHSLQYSCGMENSMDRGAWQATQSMGSQRVGHDLATEQSEKPHFLKMRQNKAAGPPSSREPALVWGGHWASGRIHSGQRGCQQSHWGWGPL